MTLTTARAKANAIAQHADDAFIVLLTMEHASLPAPLRLARNRQPVVSRGETYVAVPFEVELPTDGDNAPEARVTMSNVSRTVGKALEALTRSPTVTLELVLGSSPDTVERAWGGLTFKQASWNAATVQVNLAHIAYWDEPWPRKRVTPRRFPGLFP